MKTIIAAAGIIALSAAGIVMFGVGHEPSDFDDEPRDPPPLVRVSSVDCHRASETQSIVEIPLGERKRLVACPSEGKPGEEGYRPRQARWLEPGDHMCPGGKLAATPAISVTTGTETDLVIELRERCKPCVVTPLDWGKCPLCLLAEGGCEAVCEVPTEVTP